MSPIYKDRLTGGRQLDGLFSFVYKLIFLFWFIDYELYRFKKMNDGVLHSLFKTSRSI